MNLTSPRQASRTLEEPGQKNTAWLGPAQNRQHFSEEQKGVAEKKESVRKKKPSQSLVKGLKGGAGVIRNKHENVHRACQVKRGGPQFWAQEGREGHALEKRAQKIRDVVQTTSHRKI